MIFDQKWFSDPVVQVTNQKIRVYVRALVVLAFGLKWNKGKTTEWLGLTIYPVDVALGK